MDWNIENRYLYNVPPAILCEFNRVMDTLSNTDWERFASRVVSNQSDLRLAERKERRTDWVMNQWGMRNGTVGELLRVLEELQLLHPRDIILSWRPVCTPQEVPSPSVQYPRSLFTASTKKRQDFTPPKGDLPLPKPGPPPTGLKSNERIGASTVPQSFFPCLPSGVSVQQSCDAMCWSFEEVQQGTENFLEARQIGEGGFGHVYRATMRHTEYAVKRLKQDSRLNWTLVKESFRTEVEKLSQYRHPNIVDFAGYCVGGGVYCLLYVFMPNGSLEDRLHSKSGAALSWPQRVSVLLGSARAIQFLHSSTPQLIHGDVKSSNILLGEHLEAKLGDFGLARLCTNTSKTLGKTSTVAHTKTLRGTLAYLPDEYVKKGELGVEIDTYSFGVVLLEALTGRRALEMDSQSRTVYLKDLVRETEEEEERGLDSTVPSEDSLAAIRIWKNHLDPHVVPPSTPRPQGSCELSSLACRCLDRRKKKRPPMTEVYEILKDLDTRLKASSLACPRTEEASVGLNHSPPSAPPSFPLQHDLDSITQRMSKMGPQEDTYCPPNSCSSLSPLHTLSSHAGPSSGSIEPCDRQSPSLRVPCESDDSRGYSQYFSSPQSSLSQPSELQSPSPSLGRLAESDQSPGEPKAGPSQGSAQSDMGSERIVVNAIKQRFVQKMALYEEGRIPTSVLLSSEGGDTHNQSQEPEESEFEDDSNREQWGQ